MDKRKIRSKTRLPSLGIISTGINDNNEPGTSQASSRGDSFSNFRPVFSSTKRKKSPSPEGYDSDELQEMRQNLTSKKRRGGQENPTQEPQECRAPSRMSELGSQSSTKSRTSVMSQLLSRSNKNSEKPLTTVSHLTKSNLKNLESQRNQEPAIPGTSSQRTPPKRPSQQNSLRSMSTNTEEFEQVLNEIDPASSPQRPTEDSRSRLISPTKRLLLELTTPSKDGDSGSEKSLFSSGSSSAKKRGRFSLGTPSDKNDNAEANSARSSVSRRILENQNVSPDRNVSQIRGAFLSSNRDVENRLSHLFSPERSVRNEVAFQSPRPVRTKNKFISFLNAAGVTLMEGETPHQINADPNLIRQNMRSLLKAKNSKYKVEEIAADWINYIENEDQLKKAINNLHVAQDGTPFPSWFNTSLIKLLLRVTELQKPLLESLLQKLNEVILEAFDAESVSWTLALIQQFRFLDTIVDPESMNTSIEYIVESTPIWFQREFITFLPDIVVDSQHHTTAELLVKLMEVKPELTTVILDTILCLEIGEQYFEELRIKVTNMIDVIEPHIIPAVTRFVLTNCKEEKPAEKILQMLRIVHLEQYSDLKLEDCFTNQNQTIAAVKSSMQLSKKVAQAAMAVIKVPAEEAKPMDLIFLLLIFSTGNLSTKKNAEVILKQHLRSGYFRLSLLHTFYKDYLEVARDFQPNALTLASNLLKSDDRLYSEFGIEWFISMFLSQDVINNQRVVLEKILPLVGYSNLAARHAFTILSKMIADNEKRERLQFHCNMLKILLEKVDNLDLESVAILSDVLHGLCFQASSTSEGLQEDLFLMMQKQLASPKPLTKCKGVLGAVMAIKHSAGTTETCPKALDIFEKVKVGVKLCPRSQALFYDRMSQVVSDATNFDEEFLKNMMSYFEDVLQVHVTEQTPISDDMEAKLGLNSSIVEVSDIKINFGKFGGIVPALFRVLRMCEMRLHGNLEDINALLGAPIILPKDLDSPEPRTLDHMLYCINWIREVISGFVKQSDSQIQRQVLKRLDNLMQMQGNFQMMLSMCETRYQPPEAYFHNFPAKQFIKIEKKSTKKGKKGAADKTHAVSVPEWETFDLGSLLTSKNPTYFRQLDTTVAYLLDVKMDMTLTQTSSQAVSIAQVCFLIKELLGMLENNDSESLIRDLISLLPQVCNKLKDIVEELRENEIDDFQKREALVLLLRLINQIFSWKELFNSAKYSILLLDGLRTLASQVRASNASQIATRDLVAESYKYFALISDVAESRSINLAYAIVNICGTLMKHSKTFTSENKGKHATMAYDFLRSKDWLDKQTGPVFRNAIAGLLRIWIENEPSPLEKTKEVMEWLADDVELLEKPTDCLRNLPSISKSNFPLLFKRILEGLIKGAKNDLRDSSTDVMKLGIWKEVGLVIKEILKVCKMLKARTIYLLSVKYLIILLRLFLNQGLIVLEFNLKYQVTDALDILKLFQGATRYLHNIYCTGIDKKDTTLAKNFPAMKSMHEEFVCRTKAMMAYNNTLDAFRTGNLIKKDVEGHQIFSQSSTEESTSVGGDGASTSDGAESRISEILGDELLDESAEELNVDEEDAEKENEEDSEEINIDSI